jgi:hypothetical protein
MSEDDEPLNICHESLTNHLIIHSIIPRKVPIDFHYDGIGEKGFRKFHARVSGVGISQMRYAFRGYRLGLP